MLTGLEEEPDPAEPAPWWFGWLLVIRPLVGWAGTLGGCGGPLGPGAPSPLLFWLSAAGDDAEGPGVVWEAAGVALSFWAALLWDGWFTYSGLGSLKLGTSE